MDHKEIKEREGKKGKKGKIKGKRERERKANMLRILIEHASHSGFPAHLSHQQSTCNFEIKSPVNTKPNQ
jgi:hypothetical protein